MARPVSQAITEQTLVARMRAGPQADHKAPTQFLGPTPASSTLHPASRRTMKILVPVHAKPVAHTTGHVVVRYGLVPTAREPVLNRQCRHLQAISYTTQVYRSSYRQPQEVHLAHIGHTKRVFPQFLLTHTKGFFLLTPKSHPILLEWTFPEHDILVLKVLLEKRHQSLRGEPRGS